MSLHTTFSSTFVNEPIRVIDKDINFLDVTCQLVLENFEPTAIFSMMQFTQSEVCQIKDHPITDDAYILANSIRSYYQSKNTIARLKNEQITEWSTKVEEVMDNKVTEGLLPVLVTLPRCYEQNIKTEKLIKKYNCAYTKADSPYSAKLKFVETRRYGNKNVSQVDYLWEGPDNCIYQFIVQKSGVAVAAWELLRQHGKIKVFCDIGFKPVKIEGYNFYVYTATDLRIEFI